MLLRTFESLSASYPFNVRLNKAKANAFLFENAFATEHKRFLMRNFRLTTKAVVSECLGTDLKSQRKNFFQIMNFSTPVKPITFFF